MVLVAMVEGPKIENEESHFVKLRGPCRSYGPNSRNIELPFSDASNYKKILYKSNED